jgi:hypothetical protein
MDNHVILVRTGDRYFNPRYEVELLGLRFDEIWVLARSAVCFFLASWFESPASFPISLRPD